MAKEDVQIIIQNDGKGIGQSAFVGYEEIRNLNISDKPGIFFVNNALIRDTAAKGEATAVTSYIKWMARGYRTSDSKTYHFAIDADGKVYRTLPATTDGWALITGNGSGFGPGLVYWKEHLISATTTKLDIWNFSAWSNAWQTIDSEVDNHPMIVGGDDIVWGGAGRYIYKLQENDGYTFALGTAASYTFTARALDLPSGFVITCLAEYNDYLLIGTKNLNDSNCGQIFVWDRVSPSFDKTIQINNSDIINWIEVYNNRIYLQAGNKGEIFVSDSTNVYPFAKLPATSIQSYSGLKFYPDASMIFSNKLYFAPSADTGSGVSSSIGVYSVDLNSGVITLENTISTGQTGVSERLRITSLMPKASTVYYAAWQDDVTTDLGIDKLGGYTYAGSEAYFITDFKNVGTKRNPHTFNSLELQLTKPLTTGQSVKIDYRTAQNGAWTTINTFSAAVGSFQCDFGKTVESVQFKVILDCNASANTSPEILFIRII